MKKRMTLLSIAALALLVGPGMVQTAGADVRVNATLRTPNVTIRVGNTPYGHYRNRVYKPLPARRVVRQVAITVHDRRIAFRLSWYTGVPSGEMLMMKSRGYTWYQIGTWLRLPRAAVHAAMDLRTWNRFIHVRPHPHCDSYCGVGCDHRTHPRERIIEVDQVHDTTENYRDFKERGDFDEYNDYGGYDD